MNTVKKLNKSKASEQFSAPSYTLNGEQIENNNINAATKVTINNQEYAVDPQGNVKVTQGLMNGILMNDSLLYKLGENDSVLNIGDIVKSIKVNDQTYHPNTTGGIDLGHIGGGGSANDGELDLQLNGTTIGDFTANQSTNESININACTVVTQNGQDASVDADGKVNIGDVVKKVRFLNQWVTPASDGGVTLPSPSTTVYGALRGGAIGTYNLSNASNSYIYLRAQGNFYPSPVQFLTLDSQNGMVNILFNIKSLNITSDYNCTYELEVYIESGYDCKVWPFLCTSGIKAADIYPAVGAFVENASTSSYHLAFGYTTTAASVRNPTMMDLNAATGQYGEPINIDQQPYVQAEKGYGFYKIEATMTNKAVVHTITRLDKQITDVELNGSSVVTGTTAQVNACTSIELAGVEYQVDVNGKIRISTPFQGAWITPYGNYYFGTYGSDTWQCVFYGMPFVPNNPNSMCLTNIFGSCNLMINPISITDTSADPRYAQDYTIVFDIYCDSRMDAFDVSFYYNKVEYDNRIYRELMIGFVPPLGEHTYAFTNAGTTIPTWEATHPFASKKGYITYDSTKPIDVSLKSFMDIGHLSISDGLKKRVTLTASKDPNSIYPIAQSLTIL